MDCNLALDDWEEIFAELGLKMNPARAEDRNDVDWKSKTELDIRLEGKDIKATDIYIIRE